MSYIKKVDKGTPQNIMTSFQRTLIQRLAKRKNKKQNGFTLIELMVVVAIVGVLTAVGLPQLSKAQDRAKVSAATQEAVNFAKDCSVSLLTGATAPDPDDYDTIASTQTCVADVDVVATATDSDSTTVTVTLDGDIPGTPSEG